MSKIVINNHSDMARLKFLIYVNNIDTGKIPTDVLISLMTLENIDFSFINENPETLVSITNNKDIFTGIMFQNNEKIDCHICLEKLEKGEKIIRLRCSHILHEECMNDWIKYNNNCPVCRGNISIYINTKSEIT